MKLVPTAVTQSVARNVLKMKKNSPHIFFVGGVVGVVTGTVFACKATLDLPPILEEAKTDVDKLKELKEKSALNTQNPELAYSDKDYARALGYVYGKTGRSLIRLYGPSALITTVSIAALTGSHIQMTKRNTALTVTLAAVSKAYEEYRVRVQEELGIDKESDIYRNIRIEENADGEALTLSDPSAFSVYARLFEESNVNWENSVEHNYMFLKAQQAYFNTMLRHRGHVFLNEVYDNLGMERSQAGQVVGWVLNDSGDNFIDFGLDRNPDFISGRELNVWLDFNVDGVVYDKI